MKADRLLLPILILLSAALLFSSCSSPFADIDNLPEGTLINTSVSPDGKYTVRAYLCDGGATVDHAVRCSVTDAEGNTRNIYWNYHESEAEIEWTDDVTVSINGIILNVETGKYDYRVDAAAENNRY